MSCSGGCGNSTGASSSKGRSWKKYFKSVKPLSQRLLNRGSYRVAPPTPPTPPPPPPRPATPVPYQPRPWGVVVPPHPMPASCYDYILGPQEGVRGPPPPPIRPPTPEPFEPRPFGVVVPPHPMPTSCYDYILGPQEGAKFSPRSWIENVPESSPEFHFQNVSLYKGFGPEAQSTPVGYTGPSEDSVMDYVLNFTNPSNEKASYLSAGAPESPFISQKPKKLPDPFDSPDDKRGLFQIMFILDRLEMVELGKIQKDLRDFQTCRRKLMFDISSVSSGYISPKMDSGYTADSSG